MLRKIGEIAIYQTFDGVELYPSVEKKAAMLLCLVTNMIPDNTLVAITLMIAESRIYG